MKQIITIYILFLHEQHNLFLINYPAEPSIVDPYFGYTTVAPSLIKGHGSLPTRIPHAASLERS